MGIFWQTVFHPDGEIDDQFVVLAELDQIIDKNDELRGYMLRDELLSVFPNKIKAEDITKESRVTEYMVTSYEGLKIDKVRTFSIK